MNPLRSIFNPVSLRILLFATCVHVTGRLSSQESPDQKPPDQQNVQVQFDRDILPILAENCFKCHGPDEGTREADLRLDNRAGATQDLGGYSAITPGDIEQSVVWQRITSVGIDERMPPADSDKKLTAEQIAKLRGWIEQGAAYSQHWSFKPPTVGTLPTVRNHTWPRNGIDRFVLARLEAKSIVPSPEADPVTLLRRVYLDLIGLPPSLAEIDAFTKDLSPDAYQQAVDRLLANPHFGERWGRHWLDQARYADSNGYTNDDARSMWPYRDWVIDALNRDLPFDQFTIEQLAGDLLPEPRQDQIIATGFHRNTLINTEGGTKADQFHDEQTKDRVDTTGLVWMGLTVGCAKCHTHKYDPIKQSEYYQLYAFFASSADRNSTGPTLQVPTEQQQRESVRLRKLIADAKQTLQRPDPDFEKRREAWQSKLIASPNQKADWKLVDATATSRHNATFRQLEDQSLLVGGPNAADEEYVVTFKVPIEEVRALRLEAITHESIPQNGPGRAGNGNFVLSEIHLATSKDSRHRFERAAADHSQPQYDVRGAIDDDPKSGWAINQSPEGGASHDRVATFTLAEPLQLASEQTLSLIMRFNNGSSAYNLGRFRLAVSATAPADPGLTELSRIATLPQDKRTKEEQKKLDDTFAATDPQLGPLRSELHSLEAKLANVQKQIPTTMVMRELANQPPSHLQIRGDFLRLGDPVQPDVPAVLPGLPISEPRQTRLQLARWLVSDEHPLTARVQVNRIWMRLFGRGLVETENDFGTQGTLPTHPALLDWLATEFHRRDWSTKQMIRLIVTSATYRQASWARSDLQGIDPRNDLLARQNRLRVEAELVRDLGLAASGLLSNTIGGPSVFPPQPDGVYAFTQVAKNWQTSQGADRYRRGMYTFLYRSAPDPMLSTFDVPNFNQTCTRRDRSNTPLQSLTVANSDAMYEMAQALAARVLREMSAENDDDRRLIHAFRLCLARTPDSNELTILREHLDRARRQLRAAQSKEPNSEQLTWTAVARVLINLDEFITRE